MDKLDVIKKVARASNALDRGRPCVYGGWSNDNEAVFVDLNAPCHASLDRRAPNTYDHYVTSYYMSNDAEIGAAFFNFMKYHLYKYWEKYIHLEYCDELPYIHISDCSKIPANVLYNLSICSRVPVEWQNELKTWYILTLEGVNPGLAYLIAFCPLDKPLLKPGGKRFLRLRDRNGRFTGEMQEILDPADHHNQLDKIHLKAPPNFAGHRCFDPGLIVRRMVYGAPVSNHKSWKEDARACRPTNKIWGESQDTRNWSGKTIRQLVDEYTIQPANKEAVA